MQTIGSTRAWLDQTPFPAQRVTIGLPDGDTIVLHDNRPDAWAPPCPVALMVHGLCGSHDSAYMRRTARKLHRLGVRVFRLDMRGCGASAGTCRQIFHANRGEDIRAAIERVAQLCGNAPIAAVGFSMGANALLKMAAVSASQLPATFTSILAIAPPIDLEYCVHHIHRGYLRLYDRYFARLLYSDLVTRAPDIEGAEELDLHRPPGSLYEFDERFTARLAGFASAEDYYRRASSAKLLPELPFRTRIVAAADDPICPVQMYADRPLGPQTDLVVTDFGGHVGYIAGRTSDPDRWWLDWRIVEWVQNR